MPDDGANHRPQPTPHRPPSSHRLALVAISNDVAKKRDWTKPSAEASDAQMLRQKFGIDPGKLAEKAIEKELR